MENQQSDALRLADIVERLNVGVHSQAIVEEYSTAARELRRLHARNQELEAILDAVCAGGDSTDEVTVLPDGSAFAVYSYPLPKGHWLYAPREYEQGAEEPKELAAPILTHATREQVISAIRYAVRGATDCGKETDFDPDALVQNAVYALCGPFNKNQPHPKTDARDEESEKLLRALYDRGYEDRAKERDYDPLGASEFDAAMCAGAARAKQADTRDAERALLTVRLTSFPESNGKRNWTAQFVRVKPWKGLVGSAGGITIAHGELWNRVAFEAERARFLIGERDTEPHIRDYGTDVQTPDEWLREQIEHAVVAAAKEQS